MIQVPKSLHAQLKALAAARGVTMVDLLHSFAGDAISAGELADVTPGFELAQADDTLVFSISNGCALAVMTLAQANHVAFILDRVAYLGGDMSIVVENGVFAASRKGLGMMIWNMAEDDHAARTIVTPQVARNLARQIRTAAAGLSVQTATSI